MGTNMREQPSLTDFLKSSPLEMLPATFQLTVLVADDEAIVRTVLSSMLRRLGCTVLLASDGAEAVRLYSTYYTEIGLVIFDLMLPDMTGEQLYDQLKRVKPDLRAMLVTGYGESSLLADLSLDGLGSVLPKPFDFRELQTAMDHTLAA